MQLLLNLHVPKGGRFVPLLEILIGLHRELP